uniref:Uncharacterized protein n=1 Tax=Oryza brachyantha TaxID=4533 RepID=J3MPQ8_ORYBR
MEPSDRASMAKLLSRGPDSRQAAARKKNQLHFLMPIWDAKILSFAITLNLLGHTILGLFAI